MPDEKPKKEPIKVTDRRAFTMDGERRSTEPESQAPTPPADLPPPASPVKGEGFELRHGAQQTPERPLPSVEFSSFIVSLASTAFIQLGELEDPVSGKIEMHLEGARQMIDILTMLHAKTKGNLDAQEDEFLTGVLYELKLKFAEKASRR